jgi:hypothetical protein
MEYKALIEKGREVYHQMAISYLVHGRKKVGFLQAGIFLTPVQKVITLVW